MDQEYNDETITCEVITVFEARKGSSLLLKKVATCRETEQTD